MKIDELNTITKSVPYEKYFGEMELTKEQKESRKKIAEEMEELLIFLFTLLALYRQYEISVYRVYVRNLAVKKYTKIILENRGKVLGSNYLDNESLNEIDDYLNEYAKEFVATTFETTEKHMDDDYYFSNDRAVFVAENEANTVINYLEYKKAIAIGKTRKTWVDIRDKRERKTHLKVGGKTIGIEKAFMVGNSLMMFPKDTSMGATPEEIVNCRCTIKYS